METTRMACRLCLTETEFHVSLFGNYSRRTNMIDKILVCLKLIIEDTDFSNSICYKCANSVEDYYEFITFVKKCQTKAGEDYQCQKRVKESPQINRRVTSYVREQVFDADYTFSFLEVPEEKKEVQSSPFFSYFSPPNVVKKQSDGSVWKTPSVRDDRQKNNKKRNGDVSPSLFGTPSQDVVEEPRSLDWNLTPDDNIIKRVRERCFGRSNF